MTASTPHCAVLSPQRPRATARPRALQGDLFNDVLSVYGEAPSPMSNESLYAALGRRKDIDPARWQEKADFGVSKGHNPLKVRVRWYQNELRRLGLIERDAHRGRGFWRITPAGRKKLTPQAPGRVLVAFSTDLGVALWSSAETVFQRLDEPIVLCLTSPPYALAIPRAYGNPPASLWVDWLCTHLEPIVRNLVPGGTIALNVGEDIFEPGTPARTLLNERLLIALHERLGLSKMSTIVWHNPTKAPGPLRWASITRQQLNVAWEPVYLLSNDPVNWKADNRRVLQEHTERHLNYMRSGGAATAQSYCDGAYRRRVGSFGEQTPGKIPRNLQQVVHRCAYNQFLRKEAQAQGLPMHGATMPLKLARFLVDYLSEEGDLVVDLFGGWLKTAKAAEDAGRRWLVTDLHAELLLGAANGFRQAPGFTQEGWYEPLLAKP